MTVYKNLWAGYETYFIRMENSGKYANGISVVKLPKGWKVNYHSKYYASDLRNDREHFPIVGNIKLDKVILEEIWGMLGTNFTAEECEDKESEE